MHPTDASLNIALINVKSDAICPLCQEEEESYCVYTDI